MPLVYFNGAFVADTDAHVSIFTHALHYGTAVFEGIRSYGDGQRAHIFRGDDHYERLRANASLLAMDFPWTPAELTALTVELLRRNRFFDDRYIRPLLFKNGAEFGAGLPPGETLAIMAAPMPHGPGTGRPIRATWSKWRRFPAAACPAGAKIAGLYVNSSLARAEAIARGYDQPILLAMDGQVAEGYGANLFAVFGDQVTTPPATADILPGITRATLIEYFQKHPDLHLTVEPLAPERLQQADEAFFCGTGMEILSIGSIDGKRLTHDEQSGPVTAAARAWYKSLVTGGLPDFGHWLTAVS